MTERQGRATLRNSPSQATEPPGAQGLSPEEFIKAVRRHPALELRYVDPTRCIIRYHGPAGHRDIRLGFWAIKHFGWKRFLEAFDIPPAPDD